MLLILIRNLYQQIEKKIIVKWKKVHNTECTFISFTCVSFIFMMKITINYQRYTLCKICPFGPIKATISLYIHV